MMDKTHWLILSESHKYPYHLVSSSRAKYVRVKLSNKGELSVVLPQGVSTKHAHEFLHSRKHWVSKHLQNLPVEKPATRPDKLDLKLLNEVWQIDYLIDHKLKHEDGIRLIETDHDLLTVSGNNDCLSDIELIERVILQWCKQKAKPQFNLMLQNLAEAFGFHYNRLSIRAQKTRWGSCSCSKNINLNCKLLFMPEEIVRYVMIHELCHTVEMNHSKNFWALVEECDDLYKYHRKKLKELAREIPV